MTPFKHFVGAAALAALLPAHAGVVSLQADNSWQAFDVDALMAADGGLQWIDLDGDSLAFEFTAAQSITLSVIDAGFAGDAFQIYDHGVLLGGTTLPGASYPDSVGASFDDAWADARYSRGVFTLGAGHHLITGVLSASALDDLGQPLQATVGGVKLSVSAVPEPEGWALALASVLLLLTFGRRRLQS